MITYQLLQQYSEIAHFCTTRQGGVSVGNYGSNNLSPFSGDDPAHVAVNQSRLMTWLQLDKCEIVLPYQTHGSEIREINSDFFNLDAIQKSEYLNGVDAVFTTMSLVCIGVTTADCVPLLFFDPVKKVVAAAHAGWRGTCARIAEKTVEAMSIAYGCNSADIRVVIGPSISQNVYQVGNEVVENFERAGFMIFEIVKRTKDENYLDLWKANRISLEKCGVIPQNIETAGMCTYTEHERFFSARRLGIKSGRLLSGIVLK